MIRFQRGDQNRNQMNNQNENGERIPVWAQDRGRNRFFNKKDENKTKRAKFSDPYGKRIMRYRITMIYKILLVLAAIGLVALFLYLSYERKLYTEYEVISDEDRKDSDNSMYIAYNGNVLKYSQDGAEAFDGNNNALWNVTFEMQNPKVATCKGYAALGDFKGNHIIVVSENGEMGEVETKFPVSTFCVAANGVVAAVLEDEGSTQINLYSSKGEILANMKCTMTKSGYPVDVTLSDDGQKLGVSYMRVVNGQLVSSVAFYNFGEVGQNEIDNYVSGYDYVDTVIPRVHFINNSTAFALGDNRFIIYSGNQKPVSLEDSFLQDRVQGVFYGENTIALVYRSTNPGSKYLVTVYDDKGQKKLDLNIDFDYTDIQLRDDRVAIYNDTICQVYRLSGQMKFDGLFEEPVLLFVPTKNTTRYTLSNRDMVQTIQLK